MALHQWRDAEATRILELMSRVHLGGATLQLFRQLRGPVWDRNTRSRWICCKRIYHGCLWRIPRRGPLACYLKAVCNAIGKIRYMTHRGGAEHAEDSRNRREMHDARTRHLLTPRDPPRSPRLCGDLSAPTGAGRCMWASCALTPAMLCSRPRSARPSSAGQIASEQE